MQGSFLPQRAASSSSPPCLRIVQSKTFGHIGRSKSFSFLQKLILQPIECIAVVRIEERSGLIPSSAYWRRFRLCRFRAIKRSCNSVSRDNVFGVQVGEMVRFVERAVIDLIREASASFVELDDGRVISQGPEVVADSVEIVGEFISAMGIHVFNCSLVSLPRADPITLGRNMDGWRKYSLQLLQQLL